jgi:acetyl/propionyl-CoA carboxylase alpha subunit
MGMDAMPGTDQRTLRRVLIANRGEIAVRIARTLRDLGREAVMIQAAGEGASLHTSAGTQLVQLAGTGIAAYLDGSSIIQAALAQKCDAIHPGYGFLSESADFAEACTKAGLCFIGPRPSSLRALGDKSAARAQARARGLPVLEGTDGGIDLTTAQSFMDSLGARPSVMVKALAGGGGRGMRRVDDPAALADAFQRCQSEARLAFGDDRVYLERVFDHARHVEVQIAGDEFGAVCHFGDRDCTLQRRHQKLIEIAPAPGLSADLHQRLASAALSLAKSVGYINLGTVEFLVDPKSETFVFLEVNPRLQVEHPVTEAIFGIDLVALQLHLAEGRSLADFGLDPDVPKVPRGIAIEARVIAETLSADGMFRASVGDITAMNLGSGPGVRIDTGCSPGQRIDPGFDPLLAKVIAYDPAGDWPLLLRRLNRALEDCAITGIATNTPFLKALIKRPEFERMDIDTAFVERHLAEIASGLPAPDQAAVPQRTRDIPSGMIGVLAPMSGRVGAIEQQSGAAVHAGSTLVILEAMKMEHVITAPRSGMVAQIIVQVGDVVDEGQALAIIAPNDDNADQAVVAADIDPSHIRGDLSDYLARRALTLDAARPEAMAKRHAKGLRSARENLDDLFDPNSFMEYGAFALAAQKRRRSLDDLIRNTPADGMVGGIGTVNATDFGEEASRCVGVAYDFTVLAGTQGFQNHRKKDRLFELAEQWRLPVVLFAEGGGGRPGDVDAPGVAGLDVPSFAQWAKLSGLVPRLGIAAGRCFAGNAALLGCADTIIATKGSNIGMGGPAMIEGGGLGVFPPEAIGPADTLNKNGVIDILVDDEAQAVAIAKRYMGYFQGALSDWQASDPRLLRAAIPENRLRAYDIRAVIRDLCDSGSVIELRAGYGAGMVTALVRIEGRPFGLIANNPAHLGGAIDGDAADKAARFMQLCDGFDLPMISLCDTPGFMVGPDIEARAQVRRVSRMFVAAASMTVPTFTVVLRKGYGLGAQAMAAGGFHSPFFTIAWPTGEFGGMGLEGAVRLGYRKELEAETDGAARKALYDRLVARMYESGKALSMAAHFEIDAVIDPMDTRQWLMRGLKSWAKPPSGAGKKRPFIDTW